MYYFLMFYILMFNHLALLIFIAQLLPCRYSIKMTYAASFLLTAIGLVRFIFDPGTTPFKTIGFIATVLMVIILAFLFMGNKWKKGSVILYFVMLSMLTDVLVATIIAHSYGSYDWLADKNIYHIMMHAVSFSIIFIIFGSVSVLVWRMVAVQKFQPFYLLFFLLPISQFIIIYSHIFLNNFTLFFIGVLLCVIVDMVLLIYTISQEKKTELEEALRETRHIMELEQSHYKEIESRREELAKIRHDFNNQLSSISGLFQTGEEKSAREMISALAVEIEATKENPYCAIPVVNAVLTEKARDCAAAGIALETELHLPPKLSVEPLHLCSIFSNLLDNAITASKQTKEEKPVIRLTSLADGDYLFIKAVNSSVQPTKKTAPGRGYGSRILTDLAARYDGDYQTQYQDGIFTAVVLLLAVQEVGTAL